MKRKKSGSRKPSPKALPPEKVMIRKLPTGVRGLDEILGGGIPEFSFNIIAGTPGCGKTTLAHQIVFANATAKKPALYFTVLGEPAMKMLRYQQQYSFFDAAKLGKAIRFINLSRCGAGKGSGRGPRGNRPGSRGGQSEHRGGGFLSHRGAQGDGQQRAKWRCRASSSASRSSSPVWQATTFLVGEYWSEEVRDNPVFTVADGLFWLSQDAERNSVVRKLQIMKLRGQDSVPGPAHHPHQRRRAAGLLAHAGPGRKKGESGQTRRRLSIGIPELDKMMGGGILEGDSVLVAGPSGTGKSALATQFIAEGLRRGEPGIAAIFEERPERLHGAGRGFWPGSRRRRRKTESSRSSTCVRWTSRWMRRCRRCSTPSNGSAPSGW